MKKFISLLALSFTAFSNIQAQDNHVILISIDGLRPEFYKEASWGMTNLRNAMKNGSYADGVNSVFPSVTYPSHTAMVTGETPLKHGIYYNTPPEPLGITGAWNWEYAKIKVPTLFSLAKAKGLKSASIFWPVSVGSPADYNIPEYWYLPKQKGGSRDMMSAISNAANPKGYYEEVKKNALGNNIQEIDYNGDYYSIDDINTKVAAYTIRQHKPNFLALHLVAVDHFEHEQGRDGDKVRAAISVADNAILQLIEAVKKAGLEDKTTFIITGDHGFVDIHTAIHPNIWLAEAGLIDINNPQNWKAYFHNAGGASFLLLKDKNDKSTLAKVRAILSKLPADQKNAFDIKDRKDLDFIGADADASFALAPHKGFTFGNNKEGEVMKPAKGGTHGFYPNFKEIQTGFVTFGNKIQPNVVIPEMSLTDIAPFIGKILGLETNNKSKLLSERLLK